jgi:hypothetical protein
MMETVVNAHLLQTLQRERSSEDMRAALRLALHGHDGNRGECGSLLRKGTSSDHKEMARQQQIVMVEDGWESVHDDLRAIKKVAYDGT